MPDRYLTVPLKLNALCLSQSKWLAGAMADFSRLPYFDGTHDVNTDVTNISESIVSSPFQSSSFLAPAGFHLHWQLPKALGKGTQEADEQPQFPTVPNRWLIIRRGGSLETQAWMVESDYLWPDRSPLNLEKGKSKQDQNQSNHVCVPFSPDPSKNHYQRFRYLGRQMPLSEWLVADKTSAEYWGKSLTAIGYGEPTFTAFYPNCYSVFGFYDAEVKKANKDIQYDVWGWYSNPEHDYLKQCLKNVLERSKAPERKKDIPTLEDKLSWLEYQLMGKVQRDSEGKCPEELKEILEQLNKNTDSLGMLCYGRLTFEPSSPKSEPSADHASVTVALAHTGTEALSAYLARRVADNPEVSSSKQAIENYLEAIQLSATLEGQRLDLDARLKEARHEKGFMGTATDILWRMETVDPKQDLRGSSDHEPSSKGAKPRPKAPEIPEALADELSLLNELQEQYNRAQHEIESRQDQLFADWYKYVICAYPSIGRLRDYPSPDEVKYYIETQGVDPLERLKCSTGILKLEINNQGKIRAAAQEKIDSLAKQIADHINHLVGELDKLCPADSAKTNTVSQDNGASATSKTPAVTYRLQPTPAPRYWHANEPVVMVIGDVAKFSNSPASEATKLPWTLWTPPKSGSMGQLENFFAGKKVNSETVNTLRDGLTKQITTLINTESTQHPGHTVWQEQPWNPFLLEWEVAFYPAKNQIGFASSHTYSPGFIDTHYQLASDAIDLERQNQTGLPDPGIVVNDLYSGRSFLSPHATQSHKERIEEYFNKQHVLDDYLNYLKDRQGETQITKEQIFATHVADLIQWLKSQQTTQTSKLKKKQYSIYQSLLQAYQELQQTVCLSQCLSGLSQAFLGRRQTLQLDIADPIGFPAYQDFAGEVRNTVASQIISAPQPMNFFNPIQAGSLKVLRLRLVDTFGQTKDLKLQNTLTPDHLKPTQIMTGEDNQVSKENIVDAIAMPPRLVQGTRLNFRWLSAKPKPKKAFSSGKQALSYPEPQDDREAASHPTLNPICGWILPDFVDNTIEIYDAQGQSLGEIEVRQAGEERWRSAPQTTHTIDSIANPYLKRVVKTLCGVDDKDTRDKFLKKFLQALRTAWENIEPEDTDGDPSLAMIMGQPIAVVRASLNLQLQGLPALNQDWSVFRQDLTRMERETNQFDQVQFPIRLGDYRKLSDGLVGYWLEDEEGHLSQQVYMAQGTGIDHDAIVTTPHLFHQNVHSQPQKVTALIDPRANVHAVTGILPTKAISIPKEHYVDALKAISISFLTAPILTPRRMHLPLPEEQGYTWSWLEQDATKNWSEISMIGEIQRDVFTEYFKNYLSRYQGKNEANQPSANGTENDQTFIWEGLWDYLLDENVGWLKLKPSTQEDIENSIAFVTPYQERLQKKLREPYQKWQKQIEIALDVCAVKIRPVTTEAVFAKQALREGWLKLRVATKNPVNSS